MGGNQITMYHQAKEITIMLHEEISKKNREARQKIAEQQELEEKMAREQEAFKKQLRKDLKKITFFIIILVFSAIVILDQPCFKVKDNTIERNISWLRWSLMDSSPTERNQVWDSELPAFIKNDIQYAEKNGYNIEYNFNGQTIYLYQYKDKWFISLYHLLNDFRPIDDLTNFSIYKNKDEKNKRFIDIYGYENSKNYNFEERFCLAHVSSKYSDIDILSYDHNIPFGMQNSYSKSHGDFSIIGDYEGNFSFYKDCVLISSQKFNMGKIKEINWQYGLITTETNTLYIMFIENIEDVPILKFYYVDTIDELPQNSNSFYSCENLYSKEENIQLPIILKDSKYYVIVPEDLDTFKYASIYYRNKHIKKPENLNYKFSIVEVKNCFKYATFNYKSDAYSGVWKVDLVFSLNGYDFHKEYKFNGYESSIVLNEDSIKKFEKTVYSLDSIWENIEKIRLEYFDYYDHGWG